MKCTPGERFFGLPSLSLLLLFLVPVWLRGDQVEMLNGDRYLGKVLSLDTNTMVLQNEILGTLRLPRSKVAAVTFGSTMATNAPRAMPSGLAASTALRPTTTNTALIKQVEDQLLGSESAETKNRFEEMAAGFLSGKVTVNDIRDKAKAVAAQVKQYKQEFGDEDAGVLDSYLSILDAFIKESEPTQTNAPNKN